MQQFDDTTMDEDEFDEYVDSVLGNDMGQKLRKEILNGNKSFSDKKQAYKDAVERNLGLKPQKYSNMDIKDAKNIGLMAVAAVKMLLEKLRMFVCMEKTNCLLRKFHTQMAMSR